MTTYYLPVDQLEIEAIISVLKDRLFEWNKNPPDFGSPIVLAIASAYRVLSDFHFQEFGGLKK